ESGCGKTTVGKSILQLIQPTAGSVRYHQQELVGMERRRLRPLRSQLQFVFQDPYSSLNPRMRIIEILQEGMNALNAAPEFTAGTLAQTSAAPVFSHDTAVDALLQYVGLPKE